MQEQQQADGTHTVRLKIHLPPTMSVSVPLYWSVAKLKAFITSVNSKMNYHQIDVTTSDEQGAIALSDHSVLAQVIRVGQRQPVELWVRRDPSRTSTASFEQYYSSQVQPLIHCLKGMPLQPLLHPNYHSFVKAAEPVSQQSVPHPNRQEQPAEAQVEGGLGLGMVGVDDQNQGAAGGGGIFDRLGLYFIRIIQILSILTILQFVTYHSDYYNIVVFVGVLVAYFTIEWLKAKARQQQNQQPVQAEPQGNAREPRSWGVMGKVMAFVAERAGLMAEVGVSFVMSLFPNWTVEFHRSIFRRHFERLEMKLKEWRGQLPPVPPVDQPEHSNSQNQQGQSDKDQAQNPLHAQ